MENWTRELIAGAVTAFFAVLAWFVRTVLIDTKKVEILEREAAFQRKVFEEAVRTLMENQKTFREETQTDIRDLRASIEALLRDIR